MAIIYWRGPGARTAPLESGNFGVAGNWLRGSVPGEADSAVLPDGHYTVSLINAGVQRAYRRLGAVSIGEGAKLLIQGTSNLTVDLLGDSTIKGSLRLDQAGLNLSATLRNLGTIAGLSSASDDRLSGGQIVNEGKIRNGAGAAFIVQSSIENHTSGSIVAEDGYGLALIGSVTNAGLMKSVNSFISFRLFDINGSLTNLSNGVLQGGSYSVSGTGGIQLVGRAISVLGAGTDLTLRGTDALLTAFDGSQDRAIEQTLQRVEATAALHLLGGHVLGAGQAMVLSGTLEVRGGGLNLGSLEATTGSHLTGFGTIVGEAEIDGNVSAAGGKLRFHDDFSLGGQIVGGALVLEGNDNRLSEGSSLKLNSLLLSGGNTRVATADFHVKHLALEDASLDIGRIAHKLVGSVRLDDSDIVGSGTLRLTSDHVTSTGTSGIGTALSNAGTITVLDGTLTVGRAVSGHGTIIIGDGATLSLGVAASVADTQSIRLDGSSTLDIAAPAGFKAMLLGFGDGDTIEIAGFSADATQLRWYADSDGSGGTLRLTDASHTLALHYADGDYIRSNFTKFDFDGGSVAIGFRPTAGAAPFQAADLHVAAADGLYPHSFHAGAELLDPGIAALF